MSDGDRRALAKGERPVRIGFHPNEIETVHPIKKARTDLIDDIEEIEIVHI